ncbi:hypothetical protein Syun_013462 [Stephania yunnanensis]|uniref:Ribosomal RNA-processing protein 12-like conserved domain-containing protein n=1 Tax=Stephania yunnanensis TaxID=152371 RepID=A0AAP0JJQ0_9MAGN
MAQELKDQGIPSTHTAYLGATISSLDRLSLHSQSSDPHTITALLTLLSILLPRISPALLMKKRAFVSEPLLRILLDEFLPVDALASGLKCVSHLLAAGDKADWSDSSQLYGLVMRFICDSRLKVRKQAHRCLHTVLESFQRYPVLAPASEGITNVFERLLLLVGGSNSATTETQEGAQHILYVLDVLKDCLPLMASKSTTSMLNYFETLLDLHHSHVTRRITDSLSVLCLHPTREVAPDVLLDLLCSLALSVPRKKKYAEDMAAIVRLLDVGIRKVYAQNRQTCVVKLPVVFNALAEILASGCKEALFAAMDTMKSLTSACIDDGLVKQGVDQIKVNEDGDVRRSGPTIIEKLCATIDTLLGYRYYEVWDMAFQIVSTMFDKLGGDSAYLLKSTLKNLADMEKLSDDDFPYRKQLHDCIGEALRAIGPETFLSILPLNLESKDLSEVNVWLFPILKQFTIGGHLTFFLKSIVVAVGLIRQKSLMFKQEGLISSFRATESLVYALWSLFPAFCNYPLDTADNFKALVKALCGALQGEPDVRGVICSGLQILIQQNKSLLEGKNDILNNENSISEKKARNYYTIQVVDANLNALRSSAHDFLSVLHNIFLESPEDSGGYLLSTIGEFASISDKAVVNRLFRPTMKKLLDVTYEAVEVEQPKDFSFMQIDKQSGSSLVVSRAKYLDLAASFLRGLDVDEVNLLLETLKPGLEDGEGLIQKKAYKILAAILKDRADFCSAKLDDLLPLMIKVLPHCHFSAKRYRLDCLYLLLVHVAQDTPEPRKHEIISSFLTEIVLALKEVNRKTRNRAYDMLVQIGQAYGDEEKGGKKENLQHFFHMVAGGLAGDTPQMISAAVKGLARLAYEFSDLISAAYNVLPHAFLLLQRKNQTIIKANLGLLKVLVAKSQAERLKIHLKSVVEGLVQWQDDTKNHFKAKVKLLLEMLIKKCGMDAVKAVMPEEHMKLLSNIRKIKERRDRRIATNNSEEDAKSVHSKATATSRISRWNHTKIFSDFGSEVTKDSDVEYKKSRASGKSSVASKYSSKASSSRLKQAQRMKKSLAEDLFDKMEDDPLDLLDRQRTRSALQSSQSQKRKQESDDEVEIDSEGRLVIHEVGRPNRERSSSHCETDADSQVGSHLSARSSALGQRKRKKTSDSGWAYTGSEYASKKADGDVKRKDKLEPYAYWPLDRKMMSRRPEQRAAARKGMASVVKLTKKLEGKNAAGALSLKKRVAFKKNHGKGGKKSR